MARSILCINGNSSMNFLLQTVLSGKYSTFLTSDVYQGMDQLRKRENIDVIIVDVDYHTQENWDFIQHIKTSGLYQNTSIIVLTSDYESHNEKTAGSFVDTFFYKPFSPMEMVRSIDDMMVSQYSKQN